MAASGTRLLVEQQCRALGLRVVESHREGVDLELTPAELAVALVHLRVATRLLVRLIEFPAIDADSLYEGAWGVDWSRWLHPDATFAIHASGDLTPSTPGRRGLDHHLFVSLRIKDAIADQLTRKMGRRPDVHRQDPDVRIVARGLKGHWHLFLDASDPPLHERGFREQPGPAPLKETLAAALVAHADWQGQGRLHDPLCGSGTLIIEAVHRHLAIAPGATRTFGVERWPHQGDQMRALLDDVRDAAVEHARKQLQNADLDVCASDISPQAVQATQVNVRAAGLSRVVRVTQQDVLTLTPPPPGTLILGNPPYGERLGGSEVVALYEQMGSHFKTFLDSTLWLVDGHPAFAEAIGLPTLQAHEFYNGPLKIVWRQLGVPRKLA